jgi:hypothetical protein
LCRFSMGPCRSMNTTLIRAPMLLHLQVPINHKAFFPLLASPPRARTHTHTHTHTLMYLPPPLCSHRCPFKAIPGCSCPVYSWFTLVLWKRR